VKKDMMSSEVNDSMFAVRFDYGVGGRRSMRGRYGEYRVTLVHATHVVS